MTLHLSALTAWTACQVSDRRLTVLQDGVIESWDENANKNIVVLARDAFLTIGYAGLAHIHGVDTDRWLLETILQRDAGPSGAAFVVGSPIEEWPTFGLLMSRLQTALSGEWQGRTAGEPGISLQVVGWTWHRNRVSKSGLSVAHAARDAKEGFGMWVANPPQEHHGEIHPGLFRPLAWQLQCDSTGVRLQQSARWWDWSRSILTSWTGQPVQTRLIENLQAAMQQTNLHDRHVAELLTAGVREAAANNPTIGTDCLSIQLFPSGIPHVLVQYHAMPASPTPSPGFSPWIATCGGILAPMRFESVSIVDCGMLRVGMLGAETPQESLRIGLSGQSRRPAPGAKHLGASVAPDGFTFRSDTFEQ